MLAALICFVGISQAICAPFTPSDDNVVLEKLPEAGDGTARALRAKHHALALNPANLALAIDVAHGDLDLSRAMGDPRYLGRAQAALVPWPTSPTTPLLVMLLRATIMQSNHDFAGALAALAEVLNRNPDTAQAWLTRAAIHQAQADYPATTADCGQFARMMLGLAPDICTASIMSLTGHAPLALKALSLSFETNAEEARRAPAVALWGLTLGAETAGRLEDPSAEGWFKRALSIDRGDPYLLAAWSDWLLDHARPREVEDLLANESRVDPLLLRLAIAEDMTHDPAGPGHVADLAARFEASRLRGETVHRREEARFQLQLLKQPQAALVLAEANWTVQREPADARVLLEAAIAAQQPTAAAPALLWLDQNAVQDIKLLATAQALRATRAAKG